MIDAIIVDDEPFCCKVLATLLEKYCKEVRVVSSCTSGLTALKEIRELNPSLVFLDIEMPKMNGFEMLQKMETINFKLIFTTSYDKYALKAIRFSAIDYLLKPIDKVELQSAVNKVIHNSYLPTNQQFEMLLEKISQPAAIFNKIALPTMDGFQMISIDSIISCESDSNYTIVLLKSKQKIVVSRTLKEIEEILESHSFVRVHHSYLVNMNEIDKYVKGVGGYLLMSDGTNIDVSRSKKDFLIKKLFPKN
jgi:two-component system LytT family response regulator